MQDIINYFAYGFSGILNRDWASIVLFYWPFIFLELPRYLFTDIVVLLNVLFNKDDAGSLFVAQLVRTKTYISIIIPCYNEEQGILNTIYSLKKQSYPYIQIIVVDDGSTDNTPNICKLLADKKEILFLRNRIRGGKSSAANLGLRYAKGKYIITADADTVFDAHAVKKILAPFAKPDIIAVSGNIKVRNMGENLLTRMQAIEYLINISVGRIAGAKLNILLIVSGAFGAFRRSILEQVGGWDVGPGEDADLTMKSKLAGGKIAFAPDAVCFTCVPDTIAGFIKQQRRWNRSVIRYHFRKYISVFNPLHANFDISILLGSLDILAYQIIAGYSFIIYLGWLFIYHRPVMWWVLVLGYIIFIINNALQLFICWLLSAAKVQDIRLFLYIPLYPFFNGYFLRLIRIFAYTEELLFRTSYSDPQVPKEVLDQTVHW